jgi:riboflavin biosynthesis pyrimidine reductase
MGAESEPAGRPMGAESEPAALTPLLGESAQTLSATQAVERMRLWEPAEGGAQGERDELSGHDGSGESTRRPRVFLNMACTADGRATVGGRSGSIGNRADRELFRALRTAVDAVLVGAGTVRAERYGGLVRDEARRQLRRERGLAEEPLACIVSASLSLSPDIPLLADPAARVAILTQSLAGEIPRSGVPAGELAGEAAGAGEHSAARASVEYIRAAREGTLDLPAALAELHSRLGVRTLLCEGGPHLNGRLLAAGLVDELFLSLAPKLAGGSDPGATLRIVSGPEFDPPLELELLDALESESQLLLRYRVGGAAPMRPSPV